MSGGSMDYLCWRIEDQASNMGDLELIELIEDIAKLMHDREWFLSGDYTEQDWQDSSKKFKQKWFGSSREERLKQLIEKQIAKVREECMTMIGIDVLH